ncbi:hypothetical protein [Polycladidibacter hongkongensis]|uniref:hypothetical protein n=1 Tax=Polycladidibacter hongkongensis TaxID=1647556 RepID=UPI000835D183|nr:hypothetical protein [Pseudovibrio hongkongensis]
MLALRPLTLSTACLIMAAAFLAAPSSALADVAIPYVGEDDCDDHEKEVTVSAEGNYILFQKRPHDTDTYAELTDTTSHVGIEIQKNQNFCYYEPKAMSSNFCFDGRDPDDSEVDAIIATPNYQPQSDDEECDLE